MVHMASFLQRKELQVKWRASQFLEFILIYREDFPVFFQMTIVHQEE